MALSGAERQRRYRERHPDRHYASVDAWRRRNRAAHRAHQRVVHAIRTGRLVRPKTCEACGKRCRPHAHHADYRKPLDVRWLCPPCHKREDGHG